MPLHRREQRGSFEAEGDRHRLLQIAAAGHRRVAVFGREIRQQARDRRHVSLDEIERVADLQHIGGIGDVLRGCAPVAPFTEAVGAQRHDLLDHAEHGIADPLGLRLELGEIDVLEPALALDLLRGAFRNHPQPCLNARERRLDFEIVPRPRLVREHAPHCRRAEDVLKNPRVERGCGHEQAPEQMDAGLNTTVAPAERGFC